MPDIVMPRLSDSMEEGTILKWLKGDGDEVAKGDELVEIETDKATMTYEADTAGVLRIVAQEGDTLAIGETIATIGAAGGDGAAPAARTEQPADAEPAARTEQPADAEPEEREPAEAEPEEREPAEAEPEEREPAEAEPAAQGQRRAATSPSPAEAPAGDANGGRPKASPVARRIARERGIDLTALSGTGPGGRIVKADVEAAASSGAAAGAEDARGAAAAPAEAATGAPATPAEAATGAGAADEAPPREAERPAAPGGRADVVVSERGTAKGEVEVVEPTRTQQLIARRMAESKATVPDFTLQADIDMETAAALREQLKEVATDERPAPSYNDMVVKACAIALREFPRANGAYRDGRFELYSRVNVGVAVAAEDSLVVPTVFDADRKGLGEIARETRALAERVRAGAITPPEVSGGTFTVSTLGMFGISNFAAVINPPQAAILAVGELAPRPVARDGEVVVRLVMSVTLVCDHRILYGAPAAQFLGRVRALLERPIGLAL